MGRGRAETCEGLSGDCLGGQGGLVSISITPVIFANFPSFGSGQIINQKSYLASSHFCPCSSTTQLQQTPCRDCIQPTLEFLLPGRQGYGLGSGTFPVGAELHSSLSYTLSTQRKLQKVSLASIIAKARWKLLQMCFPQGKAHPGANSEVLQEWASFIYIYSWMASPDIGPITDMI